MTSEPSFEDALHLTAGLLQNEAELKALARKLDTVGIPLMVLKGSPLQQRLYETPAAYRSGDVDLLVSKSVVNRVRPLLKSEGWIFESSNSFLWRLSRAATFRKDGIRIDLHWGIHAAHLPAFLLAKLEAALWDGATEGPLGLLEPNPESLFVFLVVHGAGHRFERKEWATNVALSRRLVRDWEAVRLISRKAGVWSTVSRVLDEDPTGPLILDGIVRKAASCLWWILRAHFLPRSLRLRLRNRLRGSA